MSRFAASILLAVMLLMSQLSAYACTSCGCSQVCPIAVMETEPGGKSAATSSDSIIGNMVLKLAYQRDEKLQKLAGHHKLVNDATTGSIGIIAGGTLAQNVASMVLLNPNEEAGIQDSYAPGIVGLTLDAATNVAFTVRTLSGHSIKKKIRTRQTEIRSEVENVLHHLEFSQMTCPEAQKELVALIGERGSHDFAELWKSSHDSSMQVSSTTSPDTISSKNSQVVGLGRSDRTHD